MKNLFIISLYTIIQTIKKKSFIISNIIMAVFILLIFVVIGEYMEDVSNAKKKLDEIEGTPVILIDNTETFGKYIYETDTQPYTFVLISKEIIEEVNEINEEEDKKNIEGYETLEEFTEINSKDKISFEELVQKIREAIQNEELKYAISIENASENSNDAFAVKFLCGKSSNINETEGLLLTNMLKSIYKDHVITGLDVDVPNLKFEEKYFIEELTNNKEGIGGEYMVALGVSVLLFLAIYLYGHSIASSISSEKMSRIIETLLTSTKPRLIVLGKTLGMGILGIAQLLFLVLIAVFSYRTLIPEDLDIASEFLSTVNISMYSVLWMFVFFILGFLLYAFSFAVVGAIISKTEDIQIANMPLSIISLFSFYISIFTMDMPQTTIGKFASYFPFSSAFSIPAKMLAGYISMEEVYLGMIFLIISVIFVAFCAIRIYSNVILNYGNKMKIRDIFNLFIKIQ